VAAGQTQQMASVAAMRAYKAWRMSAYPMLAVRIFTGSKVNPRGADEQALGQGTFEPGAPLRKFQGEIGQTGAVRCAFTD